MREAGLYPCIFILIERSVEFVIDKKSNKSQFSDLSCNSSADIFPDEKYFNKQVLKQPLLVSNLLILQPEFKGAKLVPHRYSKLLFKDRCTQTPADSSRTYKEGVRTVEYGVMSLCTV
jgi:hypothetical protein